MNKLFRVLLRQEVSNIKCISEMIKGSFVDIKYMLLEIKIKI